MKKIIGPEETRQIPVQKQQADSAQKKTKKSPQKTNRKKDWSYYAIIASIILILIPTIFLGVTLWKASKGTGKPVFGTRFNNDLQPEITKEALETLKTDIASIEGVDSVEVQLTTATLRINISMPEGAEKDVYPEIAEIAEEKTFSQLPVETYFTSEDTKLQYDYEIYVYHLGENPLIYTRYKSSRNSEPHKQFLTDAISPEMAEELLKRQEEKDKPQEEENVAEDQENESSEASENNE